MKPEIIAKKVLMMPKNQFDRYALSYSKNREIQQIIAKNLLSKVDTKNVKKIIDIGCGDGALYEECGQGCASFLAVDSSPKMCDLHRRHNGATVFNADFDDKMFPALIKSKFGKFDLLLSSSALQWSIDFDAALQSVSTLADSFAISIFTSGTFKSVRNFLGVETFLPSTEAVKYAFDKFCINEFYVEHYEKEFESPMEAVRFIKTTGVSGGGNKISYKEAKRLYECGPTKLEFEVVYAVGIFAKRDFSIS